MLKNIIAGLFFIISVVNAESIIAEEDNSFNDFMEVMEETTELANKNKIGADHAPGIISVLTHDDMKRVGVNNLYDALELLPNVEVVLNKTGTRNLVFRGIGAIDGSGKIKIMLNGVEQNSAASGIVHFDLPIDVFADGNITITLPAAGSLKGRVYVIKNVASGATVTVNVVAGCGDIDFSSSYSLAYLESIIVILLSGVR